MGLLVLCSRHRVLTGLSVPGDDRVVFVNVEKSPSSEQTYRSREDFARQRSDLRPQGHLAGRKEIPDPVIDVGECWDAAVSPDHNIFPEQVSSFDEAVGSIRKIIAVTSLDLDTVTGVQNAVHQRQALHKIALPDCDGICSPDVLMWVLGVPLLPLSIFPMVC